MGNSVKHQDAINAAANAQYLTPGLNISPSYALTGGLIVGILAACVGMALTPPKSRSAISHERKKQREQAHQNDRGHEGVSC